MYLKGSGLSKVNLFSYATWFLFTEAEKKKSISMIRYPFKVITNPADSWQDYHAFKSSISSIWNRISKSGVVLWGNIKVRKKVLAE